MPAFLAWAIAFAPAVGWAQDREGVERSERLRLPLGLTGCVTHDLILPGQEFRLSGTSYRLSGSVGGFVVGDIVYEDDTGSRFDARAVTAAEQLQWQYDQLQGQYDLSSVDEVERDVLIVVIDDFMSPPRLALRPPDFLADMPVGAEGMDLTKTREDLRARLDDVSHGAMVMHHLNLAVSTLPGVTLLHSNGNGVTRWQFPDGRQLTVVPMNIADAFAGADPTEGTVDLGLLFDSVAQELTGILELFQPVAVVLNMSWVFLPCASVEEFEEVKDTEFSDYSSCTARLFEGTAWAHIDESVRQALLSELDPKTWITEALGSVEVTRVAFVGAAGNLGLDYSLLPAHWDGVTAATVQASPGFVGRYWNTGDVAVPGEWLAFQALDLDAANAPVVGPATVLSYAGTSYSAPATSLLIALDMMRQGDVCDYTPGRDSPLTFVPGANSHVKDMNREYAVARASCAPLQGP